MESVASVSRNLLCTGCGGCMAVCPVGAIAMAESPAGFLTAQVQAHCIGCGKCRTVCPSVPENTKDIVPEDLLHGKVQAGFIGCAKNPETRLNGQSGGVVTALLAYLLESGQADGAVVNRFDSETRRPKAVIAETAEEIYASAGSYYTQSAVLPVLRENPGRKLAAVVLGCQGESLHLMEKQAPELVPEYRIGLICAGQNSGHMVDDICEKAGAPVPTAFRFRDKKAGGWPGEITVQTGEENHTLPNRYRHQIKPLYESFRCLSCFDQMNVWTDLVCGDPWNIPGKDTPEGWSVILARTEKGLRLLRQAEQAGVLVLESLPEEEIFRGQTVDDRHQNKVAAAKKVAGEQGWAYPYDPERIQLPEPSAKALERNREKLLYTRSYAGAKTPEEAARLAEEKRNRKPPLAVRIRKWLNRRKKKS